MDQLNLLTFGHDTEKSIKFKRKATACAVVSVPNISLYPVIMPQLKQPRNIPTVLVFFKQGNVYNLLLLHVESSCFSNTFNLSM